VAVVVVGLNHRTVPLELLERLTVDRAQLPKALATLHARDTVAEIVLLSTCHRTEVYAVAERFHGAVGDVRSFLCDLGGLDPDAIGDHLYAYHDEAVAEHLFSVASGIDSIVVGESEILGQVRGAWEAAASEGTAGQVLGSLFRHAVEAGKRARHETAIGRRTTSVSQAAVAMASERVGGLTRARVLVVGAGEIGETMAHALAAATPAQILVANRTAARARALAARVGGQPIALDRLADALVETDLVLTCTGADRHILDADDMRAVMEARAGRPLLIVDVAVPRDIEPGARAVDGVTLLDMDDLKAFAAAGANERRREVSRVRALVTEEVERWLADRAGRQAAPVVTSLRAQAEAVRQAELERFQARLQSLDPRQREAVEALTKGIVAKLLHEPTVRLKDAAGTPTGERLADALRSLFDLS
jgi:glutamyl-tRNA reductase